MGLRATISDLGGYERWVGAQTRACLNTRETLTRTLEKAHMGLERLGPCMYLI